MVAGHDPYTQLTRDLRSAFEDSARANHILGAQLAVSLPGRPVWSAEFGTDRPGMPMTPDRLLGTGSISKMFAAVAALRLVDRGLLSTEDTLGRWFAAATNVAPGISVRALLWHQSGLPEYAASPEYGPAVAADRNHAFAHEDLVRFVGPPTFAPGTAWRASNSDRLLLGIIVAAQSGEPYGAYLRTELFRDGKGENWTPGDGQPPRELGTHWGVDPSGQRFNYTDQFLGPAVYTSRWETYISARDLAVFARRLFDGDLLSAAGREQLLTIVEDDHRIAGQTGGGVGIRRFEYFGRTMYGNSGATPNSSALYLYDRDTGAIVVLSTNLAGEGHGQSHFRIVPALVRMAADFAQRHPG
jgi:D-alanyl-D-alanine carboxypeptidase